MVLSAEKLRDMLVRPGHVAEADFVAAASEAKKQKKHIEDILLDKGLIKDEQLGQLVAAELGIPYIHLNDQVIDDQALFIIPELVARSVGVVAFARGAEGLKVGASNKLDLATIHLLEKRSGQKILTYYITPRDLHEALARYHADAKTEFKNMIVRLDDQSLSREERDSTIVSLVDMVLHYGQQNKASDIHMEPHRDSIVVRFRIDGVMHDVLEMPKRLHDLLLTRIKILAKLRTDEHRAAQDGKLVFEEEGETIDVRVSIVPITEGENVVLRLLSSTNRQLSLADLGLSGADLKKVSRAIDNPHGMVLVTGPTGSGKTTTVYAMLKILNVREVHISTIEDPVEYDIEGISQIQVNTRTNLTFAKGLRAIVRQDPDIIMVGEIRDQETADIAVNSAMTGHLVLSTLHANDAPTTLPRLLDMGVEPYLVASTVNIIIAQRLVRRICDRCKQSHVFTKEEKALIEEYAGLKNYLKTKKIKLDTMRLYEGAGCPACAHTGFLGRIGIFELLEMDEDIRRLVALRAPSAQIMQSARERGMTSMFEDGIEKVLGGITTLNEVLRATKE